MNSKVIKINTHLTYGCLKVTQTYICELYKRDSVDYVKIDVSVGYMGCVVWDVLCGMCGMCCVGCVVWDV